MTTFRTPAGPSVSVGSWLWLIADSAVPSFALPSVLHSLSSGNGLRCGPISPPAGAMGFTPHYNTIVNSIDSLSVRWLNSRRAQPAPEHMTLSRRESAVRDRQGNRPLYVISIAADLAGGEPRTLRIYEEKGLLSPQRRNRIRLYADRDLERVRLIRYLTQELGVNLAGVKLLLEVYEQREEGHDQSGQWSVTRRTVRVRRSDEGREGKGGRQR